MDLRNFALSELTRSNVDKKHPFNFFFLCTKGDFPEVRTVVKRTYSEDHCIVFFTDSRSPKVEQIKSDPRCSALFYHPKKQLQVRIRGHVRLIRQSDSRYSEYLNRLKQHGNLKDYTSNMPPGTPLKDLAEVIWGEDIFFCPLEIKVHDMDVLLLNKDRHIRTIYTLDQGEWNEQILTP